jgi:DNA invertase Pin-like site-specific DNA recombinase
MNALKPRPSFDVLIMSEESRLGRETIETAYALKQIIAAGVRVFFYRDDRERTLDSPTDKILLSLTTFADELEREKARQRVTDAMTRKARAGHVTGGRCFGYTNVEVLGPDGQRSHVDRRINDAEALVVRRIFDMCAAGYRGVTEAMRPANINRGIDRRRSEIASLDQEIGRLTEAVASSSTPIPTLVEALQARHEFRHRRNGVIHGHAAKLATH